MNSYNYERTERCDVCGCQLNAKFVEQRGRLKRCFSCDLKQKQDESPAYQVSKLTVEIQQIKEILREIAFKLNK